MLSKSNLDNFFSLVKEFAINTITRQAQEYSKATMSRESAELVWIAGTDLKEIKKGRDPNISSMGDVSTRDKFLYHGDEERIEELHGMIESNASQVIAPANMDIDRAGIISEENGRYFLRDRGGIPMDFGQAWYGGFQVYHRSHIGNKDPKKGEITPDEYLLGVYVKGADILVTATLISVEAIINFMKKTFKHMIRSMPK
jgi:hypothetical protein